MIDVSYDVPIIWIVIRVFDLVLVNLHRHIAFNLVGFLKQAKDNRLMVRMLDVIEEVI